MNDCESMVLIKAALVAKEVWMERRVSVFGVLVIHHPLLPELPEAAILPHRRLSLFLLPLPQAF
jgi:hypothetical protein